MNTTTPSQKFLNPNPTFDQVAKSNFDHKHNDLLYFHDISSYLMSDEDHDLENRVVSVDYDECVSSLQLARNK